VSLRCSHTPQPVAIFLKVRRLVGFGCTQPVEWQTVISSVSSSSESVVALAGRRIDAENAQPARFPDANAQAVRASLSRSLQQAATSVLIASAACGSDLLALDAASDLNIRVRIVLPFATDVFRRTSVVDRTQPAYWGALYDRIIAAARECGDLIVLDRDRDDPGAYVAANEAIIGEALLAAEKAMPPARLMAVIVWEGQSRGNDDVTDDFRRMAEERGFSINEISTIA
jgi:hypothetical protein